MTAYLTREAVEALRKRAVSVPGEHGLGRADVIPLDALDSLPVVDAVPAEEALERFLRDDYPVMPGTSRSCGCGECVQGWAKRHERRDRDIAAVRHALRAAQAQADAPPPPNVIRRGHDSVSAVFSTLEYHAPNEARAEAWERDIRAAMHPLPKEG